MSSSRQPGVTEMDPTELLANIRAGEPWAEEELFQRYRRPVGVILRQLLPGQPEAEDLLQETFRLALPKIRGGEVHHPEHLGRFITSLARNLAINHFRLRRRRRTEPDHEAVARVASTASDPLGDLLSREKARLVRRLIAELPTPRDREILFRFYIAEEDKQRICSDLDLSALHFNRVLHRARQRYKELYEEAVGRG